MNMLVSNNEQHLLINVMKTFSIFSQNNLK